MHNIKDPSAATFTALCPQAPSRQRHQRLSSCRRTIVASLQRNIDLLGAVLQQVQNEVPLWVGDLLEPLLQLGPPAPLADTLPPQTLGDPDSKFVEVEGVMLHYKEIVVCSPDVGVRSNGTTADQRHQGGHAQQPGSSPPTTILLLHGFNGSTFNWRFMMEPLAEGLKRLHSDAAPDMLRVIAFDRPPFGLTERPHVTHQSGSTLPFNPYTTQGAAKLARGLLHAVGVESAIVMGHSAGAGVAMDMAVQYPEAVSGLVFICPALPDGEGKLFSPNLGTQLRFALTRAILAQDSAGICYIRRVIGRRRDEVLEGKVKLFADDSLMSPDAIDGYLRPMRAHAWDVGMLETMRSFSLNNAYDYRTLSVPVLFVQGETDEPLATLARKVSATLSQRDGGSTTYRELSGVGHIPMEEAAEETYKEINDWLAQEYRGQRTCDC